jgi:hypothetical protein
VAVTAFWYYQMQEIGQAGRWRGKSVEIAVSYDKYPNIIDR